MNIEVRALEDLKPAAKKLISEMGNRRKLAFSGEMGAGKTTLIQALCSELGVAASVSSPTFALINEYSTSEGIPVYHFDLYRIEKISELYDMGYEDYFYSDAYCFVEWPEKAPELIPEDFMILKIRVLEDGTRMLILEEQR